MIRAPALAAMPAMRHAFFTREGGVSEGLYASLAERLSAPDQMGTLFKVLAVTPRGAPPPPPFAV